MAKTFNQLFPRKNNGANKRSSIWTRAIRVVYDAARGFIEDDCYSKASALTFYSILSIVPLLAVLFGIAKGFGLEQVLEIEINTHFNEQRELVNKLIQFSYSWLQSVKGDVIAGFGVFVLFWSVVGLLSSIETTLNAIWKMPISRGIARRISDYLATIVICPFFLITSSSITLWLSRFAQSSDKLMFAEVINPLLLFLLKLFPYLLSWVLFTFIYLFLPNTKVYMRSAVIAGFIGGTAFQLWQWIYIKFQIGVASYGAIYGSFAALPLFLVWLQFSWMIFLVGAELAFEIENDLFIPNRQTIHLSLKSAALLITYRCIEAFLKGSAPQTDRSLAHELGISLNHLHLILEALQNEHILSAVSYQKKNIGYQPARAIETITFELVCNAIDHGNEILASVEESASFQHIQHILDKAKTAESETFNQPVYTASS